MFLKGVVGRGIHGLKCKLTPLCLLHRHICTLGIMRYQHARVAGGPCFASLDRTWSGAASRQAPLQDAPTTLGVVWLLYDCVHGIVQHPQSLHRQAHSITGAWLPNMVPSEQPVRAEVLCLAASTVYRRAKPHKDATMFVINKEGSLQHEQYALEVFGIQCILLMLQAVFLVAEEPCVIL